MSGSIQYIAPDIRLAVARFEYLKQIIMAQEWSYQYLHDESLLLYPNTRYGVRSEKIISVIALSAITSVPATADKRVAYTYDSFSSDWGAGPKIKKAFQEKCACELEFITLDNGVSILRRAEPL